LPDPGSLPGMGAMLGREEAAGLAAVPRRGQKPKKNRVPAWYTDPNQTPFRTIEVKSGDQTLDFDLQTDRRGGVAPACAGPRRPRRKQSILGAGRIDTSPERQRRDRPVAGAPGLCQNQPRPV